MSIPSSHDNADRASERAYLAIPAGGRGLRMGGGEPKQFRDWQGRPLLKATIEAFLGTGMPSLAGISLAVPPDRMDQVRAWDFGVPLFVVPGGPTRQASVAAALAALPDLPDLPVLIHDAVRPFPPVGPILEALAGLGAWDGTLLGEPSTDTLKRVDAGAQVLGTEPRASIFRAQTPQAALLSTWRRAFAWAEASGFEGTDDASLLEAMGLRVKLVPAPGSNRKITLPEDWA